MSLPAHKEFRFLLPALQLLMPICGSGLYSLQKTKGRNVYWKRLVALVCLALQLPTAIYFSLVHQRGTISVMSEIAEQTRRDTNATVLYLMPCHQTPFYSHVHQRVDMTFPDCSPEGWESRVWQLNTANFPSKGFANCLKKSLKTSEFFRDPAHMLETVFDACQLPTYIVMFKSAAAKTQQLLEANKYEISKKLFNAHFSVDENGLQDSILMYRKG